MSLQLFNFEHDCHKNWTPNQIHDHMDLYPASCRKSCWWCSASPVCCVLSLDHHPPYCPPPVLILCAVFASCHWTIIHHIVHHLCPSCVQSLLLDIGPPSTIIVHHLCQSCVQSLPIVIGPSIILSTACVNPVCSLCLLSLDWHSPYCPPSVSILCAESLPLVIAPSSPWREAEGFLMSPPCLESQGCQFEPTFLYLLSCSSA